jgi:protein KIBRA
MCACSFGTSFAVCSTGSSSSSRYDPDLLRSDVALAKNRVARLKLEVDESHHEMQNTKHGVEMLSRYVCSRNQGVS